MNASRLETIGEVLEALRSRKVTPTRARIVDEVVVHAAEILTAKPTLIVANADCPAVGVHFVPQLWHPEHVPKDMVCAFMRVPEQLYGRRKAPQYEWIEEDHRCTIRREQGPSYVIQLWL